MMHLREMIEDMFSGGTVNDELSSTLKTDPNGEAMRRYQRQLAAAREKVEGVSRGAREDTSIKALQAGMALLPTLWRDLNRR